MSAPSSECFCKISKIRTYSGSRSSKVIDLRVNRKPMYDFLLVTNSNLGRICCRFRVMLKARKSRNFHTPPFFDTLPSDGTPLDMDVIYTPMKSAFNGLQFSSWHYRSIFIRLTVVASQSREITPNSDKIWPYSSSRSSKVIDLRVNRKPMYDFLLVTNSNLGCICYCFRDIDA